MENEVEVVLQDNFYRDGIGKILIVGICLCIGISAFVGLSLYLFLTTPAPVQFHPNENWQVQPSIPLNKPFQMPADLLQWVSEVLPQVFVYDFSHYNDQLQSYTQYFTPEGWKIFLNQLNIYANYTNVQANKLFINSAPTGAPIILNQKVLSGRYAWWVQMPVTLYYVGGNKVPRSQALVFQVLVVRVSTLDNLSGLGIDNVIVANGAGTSQ